MSDEDDTQSPPEVPPPWGGGPYGPWHPELIPPVDPAEFEAALRACVPREWPKEYADVNVWWRPRDPIVDLFANALLSHVGMNERRYTPLFHRFQALMYLLERGELGPGWPTQRELIESSQTVTLHPALLRTAAQLSLNPEGRFDPVAFRREAVRTAKRMRLTLPPGLVEG